MSCRKKRAGGPKEGESHARERRAPSVEGGADGCGGARYVSVTNGCEIVIHERNYREVS